MAEFRPQEAFTLPVYLLKPTYTSVKGVRTKVYPEPTSEDLIFCSLKSFGGTETTINDAYAIEDTATMTAWFRPDITADCAIQLTTGERYEIINKPENINMRNQWLQCKVRAITGGA
uniref:hypothetical protein n=1 Tax=Eisenbergiella sp. TaxID=1924109 RepID=UPI003AB7167E